MITTRDGTSHRFALEGTKALIGRAEDSDIHLPDSTVSRRHAEFYRDPFGRWWIRDLGSHNRTIVNGREVTESLVGPSDRVQIGACVLRVAPPRRSTFATTQTGARSLSAIRDPEISDIRSLDEVRQPKIGTEQLSTVLDFGQNLLECAEPERRLERLCEVMLSSEIGGDVAMILRVGREGASVDAEVLCEGKAGGKDTPEPRISGSVLSAVLERRRPVMATNTEAGAQSLEMTIMPDAKPVGILVCPLEESAPEGAETIDVLYVMIGPSRATAEWLALMRLAVQQYREAEATLAANQRAVQYAQLEQELSKAEKLQRGLVPSKPLVIGLETAIGFEPCRWVGGDFVDVLGTPDKRALLLIADVCGKGLDAALVSASLHTTVRTGIRAGVGLAELMTCLNEQLFESLPADRFVTMLAIAMQPDTGSLEIVNAGHMPPIMVSGGGDAWELEAEPHLPLGVAPGELRSHTAAFEPGQTMLLCTDGLTELSNAEGRMLGMKGLAGCFAEVVHGTPDLDGISRRLHERLMAYAGSAPAQDDMTYLLARRPGAA